MFVNVCAVSAQGGNVGLPKASPFFTLPDAGVVLERAALDEQMHARVDRPEQELNTAGVYAEINERLRGEESADITWSPGTV